MACDRFEHKFEPEANSDNYIIDFFNTFADSISTFPENINGIISFYNDDYNNNGVTKSDVENFYNAFTFVNTPLGLEATLIDTTDNFEIQWRLLATELSSGTTYMDTIITDVLLPIEESFIFYGNQADMRNVIVELFTGQWCSNCPSAEEALHNLRMQYGSRFSYVEYHWDDDLETNFAFDLFQYYPNTAGFPFGVINGNAGFIYTAPSVEEVQTGIETAIIPLLQESLSVLLTDIQTNITDTLLTGSVQIEVDSSISTDNLTLVAVLMEVYNEEYPNHHGDPHHNIALKRITVDISTINQSDTVEFIIDGLDVLPTWYENDLPEDLTLVLWVQTIESEYNQNTCAAYNVIEISINN
jgi:thiol-disulfide isomerase/thioredoxin